MGGAPEDLATLGQVLRAIVTGPLVGRAQELDDRDELAPLTVANFQEGDPFDIQCWELDFRRGFQDPKIELAGRGGSRPDQGNVGTAEQSPGLRRQFVDVNVLFELDEVVGTDPGV
jgi:hypothetical protein